MIAELQRRKIPVHWSGQMLVNAITVTATPETAAELRNIPGVAHVVATPPLYMDLDTALDLTNVSAAWSLLGGPSNAGAGMKIGIIDSGIDQNHPGFQDPSLTPPAGFPKCSGSDCAYTNNKVIVARSYVSLVAAAADPANPLATAWPDDLSPRDRQGHGTAIAMIAAGVQNTSPRGAIQGVAPKAFLGNSKIFGSPGVNYYGTIDAALQALEDALSDQMDVVTLSLHEGDPEWAGPLDVDQQACGGECDVLVQAVENAVQNGLVVVAAAGNDGNISGKTRTLTTIHTPGTAPSAITVGATMNSHQLYQSLTVNGSSLGTIHGLFGDGPHIQSAMTAPIVDVASTGNDGYACAALPAGSLSGSVALIQRGNCFDSNKIINAQNAGAIGVVLYLASGQNTPFSSLGVQDTGIPAMVIG
ncbi:MAG TPA: S8 family serine peptidase, partial [Rhizomicrobium sp.]|nr:S8 family serine peptidase [Rhizomicrobium sp.]